MYTIKKLFFSIFFLPILSACNSSVTSSLNSTFRCEPTTQLQQQMLALVNQARAQSRSCGGQLFNATTAVTWNDKLVVAARVHSDDMAANDFFAHQGSNGQQVADRAQNAGYAWITIGENLFAGAENSAQVVQGWLDSPGHCVNIMNPNFKEMAVACRQNADSEFGTYHTQVLGTQ